MTNKQSSYNKLRQAMGIQEAPGVGILTKQNTTKDVKKGKSKKDDERV